MFLKDCWNKKWILFFVFLIACISCTKDPLEKDIPKNEIAGWKRHGSPEEYKGEDLYLYIDGGAEIYHEYGFSRVIVQNYSNKNGKFISLEIFKMKSPESAFGIYTFKTSTQGKIVDIGTQGCLESYYLNFWKGKTLVTLTGDDQEEETIRGLQEIARAVNARLQDGSLMPSIVSLLPQKDLIESSVKYFRGNLSLFNNHRFFEENIFRIKEGLNGEYRSGDVVYIFKYDADQESHKIFIKARENFKASPHFSHFEDLKGNEIQVKNEDEKLIFMTSFKKYILIIVGAGNPDKKRELVNAIKEKA